MPSFIVDVREFLSRHLRYGLGCAQFGKMYVDQTDESAAEIVDAAWDAGVRYFDTAPLYGRGASERRLGAALVGRPRNEYLISTKVGRLVRSDESGAERMEWDFSRAGILASVEESLQRLGLERVDILLLHDAYNSGDTQLNLACGEGLDTLLDLRDQGVVSAVGAGANDIAHQLSLARDGRIDVMLLPGRYTLLDQSAYPELLETCERNGIAVLNAAVYETGILATDEPGADDHYEYGLPSTQIVARVREIAEVCHSFDIELPRAALQFSFTSTAVAAVVAGADNPRHVRETIDRLSTPVPDELWQRLRGRGLIPG